MYINVQYNKKLKNLVSVGFIQIYWFVWNQHKLRCT